MKVNQILYTKDGRNIGNAIIVAVEVDSYYGTRYKLKTDYGNEVRMTEEEIRNQFYLNRGEESTIPDGMEEMYQELFPHKYSV